MVHALIRAFGALALTSTLGATGAAAQGAADYPNKPVRFVVSAAAGGGNDFIARIVGERLQNKFGQTFVIENRPGAGNNLAAEYVYRQPNDGYTMLVSPPAPLVVNSALFKDLRFDPDKLEPVSISSYIPNVLVVRGNAPWKTAQEFFAYAKANPGKLNYGSQGNGTTGHLTAALMEMMLGVKHAHVPYGGAAPALNDLAAGHIDFMFADIGTVLPLSQGGQLRLLAATTKVSPAAAKGLPTIAEVGYPDLLSDTWTAFTAPPGTPLAIREKLSVAIREAIFSDVVKAKIEPVGVEPWGLSPAEMAALVKTERERWTGVVTKANVKLQ
jgi:tripartite-type tricarboxylate transporter receptor subunit TctC